MNSEGVMGVLIEWIDGKTQATRNYSNLQENVDFIVLNWSKMCPVTDGRPIDFTGAPNAENLEWLMYANGDRVDGFDVRIYQENQIQRPTNIKNATLTNYNQYLNQYYLVKRTNEELIAMVRQLENEANLSVQNESEKAKMSMMVPAVLAKLASGSGLTEAEQNVYDRMMEVNDKAIFNADVAKTKIEQIKAGQVPNLDEGWEYDNVTPKDFPFNS